MPIIGVNSDTYSNSGTNIFNDQYPTAAGHRPFRIVVTLSL
jgi:hypothetical protein